MILQQIWLNHSLIQITWYYKEVSNLLLHSDELPFLPHFPLVPSPNYAYLISWNSLCSFSFICLYWLKIFSHIHVKIHSILSRHSSNRFFLTLCLLKSWSLLQFTKEIKLTFSINWISRIFLHRQKSIYSALK